MTLRGERPAQARTLACEVCDFVIIASVTLSLHKKTSGIHWDTGSWVSADLTHYD